MSGVLTNFKRDIKRAKKLFFNRLYVSPKVEKEVVDSFHKLYYHSSAFGKTWQNTNWLGVATLKCPLDLWIYQETIFETRPDVIVECGTAEGGTTLYLASIFDLLGTGRVVSIDIDTRIKRPPHPRITYIEGSSTDSRVVQKVTRNIGEEEKVLVILDSDHSKEHVLNELTIYGDIVSKGCYIIVEDSNVNGHPVLPNYGPGPMEAINEFLAKDDRFIIDDGKEKFYMTFNPRGYLKKVK